MFEWNEEDGLDTIWGDLIEREDHIVPYPNTCENDALFGYEDYDNKLKGEKKYTQSRSYEQNRPGQKDDLPGRNEDPTMHYNAELPHSRFSIDPPPSFTSIKSSIRKEGDGNDHGSTSSSIFNDFTDASNFNPARDSMFAVSHSKDIENDSEPGHTEVDSFLDCDWATITDLEDLDGIFRNSDCALGHDERLSPTSSINASEQPLRMPESIESHAKQKSQEDQKVHEQKKLLKSRRKDEVMCISNLQKVASTDSRVTNLTKHLEKLPPAVSAFLPSAAFPQQTQVGEPAYLGYHPSQQMVMGYGYPAPPYPTVPLVSFVPTANKNCEPVWASNVCRGHARHRNPVKNQREASPRTLSMTPQEKIEKLRRRQQLQALLAIKQQGKQFGQQITSADLTLSQLPSQSVMNTARKEEVVPLSELSMPAGQEELPNISASSDDYSLQETIFHELQETVIKLDHNVRLCMRDSLFRLAKSAMERRRANNGNVAKSIKDENNFIRKQADCNQERSLGFTDAETDTNPIDRTVAHLIFHRPSQQPVPAPEHLNVCDSNPEGKA